MPYKIVIRHIFVNASCMVFKENSLEGIHLKMLPQKDVCRWFPITIVWLS